MKTKKKGIALKSISHTKQRTTDNLDWIKLVNTSYGILQLRGYKGKVQYFKNNKWENI